MSQIVRVKKAIRRLGLYNLIYAHGSISAYAEDVWGLSPARARRLEQWFEE